MCNNNFENKYKVFSGDDARMLKILEDMIAEYCIKVNAEEVYIPALISKKILNDFGYFKRIPDHITGISVYENNKYNSHSSYYLTPAACLHIYPIFRNQNIRNKIVTTKARVYRYEHKGFEEKTRYWDFTVREIVYIGDNNFLKKSVNNFQKYMSNILYELEIDHEWKNAFDYFIDTRENNKIQQIQMSNSLKQELIVNIDGDIAVGSANFHLCHFSFPMNFHQQGEIETACIGIGLERMIEVLNKYGITVNKMNNTLEKVRKKC